MSTHGKFRKKSNEIFDPIRKRWVAATPEEVIRQRLIKLMIEELGYPLSLIAIEKELSRLPHLQLTERSKIPKRRADLIVFTKVGSTVAPLLMIECKAVPLSLKFAQQVIGYNAFVQAPYLAIANETTILTGFFDKDAGHFKFEEGLPTFDTIYSCNCSPSTLGE